MSKISTYEVAPLPKLADKLIGTSVGGEIEDVTYNFTLQELLDVFLPVIPANNLQGVLDYGNTATQDINLFGTITTTNLEVTDTANFLDSYFVGETHIEGGLFDVTGSIGTSGQVLTSTGTSVDWVTLPPIFTPNLQQVLDIGNTSDIGIILDAGLEALDVNTNTATINTNITIDGTITDGDGGVGVSGSVLSSTLTGVKWIPLPVYSATSPLLFNSATGVFSIQQATSSQNGYLSSSDWITFDGKQNAGNYITALTGEATASGPGSATVTLSNAAVIGKVLTGFNPIAGTINGSDSILTAFGKTQSQINSLVGGVLYKGTWNASANLPTLTSSVGVQGNYYVVNVAGNTNLNGITDWKVGDWAIFSESVWQKVDNTESVSSVNGFTGAVELTTDDIPEGTVNLYFLNSRARQSLSFLPGSGAYDNTSGAITIPTNNNQILNGAGYIVLGSLSANSPLSYNNTTGAFSIQVANSSQNGYLSSTDWNTFNGKQGAITLTTTGTSGPSTLIGNNLNIPDYGGALTGYVPYTGATGPVNLGAYDLTVQTLTIGKGLNSLSNNTALGYRALFHVTTGNYNTAVGYESSHNITTGQYNTSLGQSALFTNTTGSQNTALGLNALLLNTSGGSNVVVGLDAMQHNASGSSNTALGYNAGSHITGGSTPNTTASNSIYIGRDTKAKVDGGANEIVIGNAVTGNGSNTVTIGNSSIVDNYFTGSIHGGSFIRLGGTSSQFLKANGSIDSSAYITLTNLSASAPLGYNNTTGAFTIQQAGASTDGYLSSTDWNTFNNKQPAGSYVPTSRTLTINGVTYDLSADRTWSITAGVSSVTATSPLFSSGGSNPDITIQQASGSQNGYLSSTDWTTFNNKQASGSYITSLTGEATGTGPGATAVTLNNASVTAKVLTGINITGGTVQATDTMLTAFGKLQNQINGLIGSTIYQGTWNASTNTPALASGVGVRGYYYIVSVAGTTNLDGITDWFVGDWVIFDGTSWQQVDNTDSVTSVNGFTGAVSLTTDNISEGTTNLYFLNSRARTAISLTTIGTSGAATYNNTTGVFNIPNYSTDLSGYVPYTGAIGAVNLGAFDLTVNGLTIGKGGGAASTNTAIGNSALFSNTTGNQNVAVGGSSFQVNTSGVRNTGVGYGSGIVNTTGQENTGVGWAAISSVVSGSQNTAVGASSLQFTTGNLNTAIGYYSGGQVSSGLNNTLLGMYAGSGITTGSYNTIVGGFSLSAFSSTLASNVILADGAGNIRYQFDGTNNIFTSNLNGTSAVFSSSVTGNTIVKSGGTSSQFLKADGSVDSSTYLTTSAAASTYLPLTGGTLSGQLSILRGSGTGLDVASDLVIFRASTGFGSPRQITLAAGNGPTTYLEAKGYGGNYITDFGIRTYNASGTAFEVFFATSAGNVGIGNTAPAAKLDVNGTFRAVGAATFSSSVAINGSSLDINPSSGNSNITLRTANVFEGYIQAITGGGILFGTGASATERMRITSGGNVGIGTSSPSGAAGLALVLNSGASQGRICIKTSATGDASGAGLQIGMAGVDAFIEQRENAALSFATNATERMRITSGGNVVYNKSLVSNAAVNSGDFTLDTAGTTIFLGALGAVNIGSFSGMVLVTNTGNGVTMLFLCGGGFGVLVSQSTAGAAGTMTNFAGSGYTFTTAATFGTNYSFQLFRTRTIA